MVNRTGAPGLFRKQIGPARVWGSSPQPSAIGKKEAMKHLLVIAGILFSTSAMAADEMSPVGLASGVARKLATKDLDVVEFMDFKCSVKIKAKDQIPTDDACRAHIVSSNGSTAVYEFFFDNLKKDFSIRTVERSGIASDGNRFFFDVNSIQVFEGDPIPMHGSCASDAGTGTTECHMESSDNSEMSIDISTQRATMVYVKVDGKETSTGLDL